MLLKPKSFLSLLFVVHVCCKLTAQDTTIDSLRSVLSSTVKDDKKLTAYVLLTGKLSLISFNETIKIAEKGIELASKLKDSLAYAELNRNMGISLTQDADGISITIEDNGRGFEYNSSAIDEEGIGLKNILSRILFLKGTVEFDSSPGNGTLVAIHIPA